MKRDEAESAAGVFRRCEWDVWAVDDKVEPGSYVLCARRPEDNAALVYGTNHNDMKVLVLLGQVSHREKFKPGDCVKCAYAYTADDPSYRDLVGTVTGFDCTRVLVTWGEGAPRSVADAYPPEDLMLA